MTPLAVTQDHARLQLDISYNWHFTVRDRADQEEAAKLFCVADFTGDLCKAMASRIRGAVSSVTFSSNVGSSFVAGDTNVVV